MSRDSQHTYLAIADSLRISIQTGEFAPGEKLPTARALMSRHKVATHTVTSALKVLQDEGLTYSVHGRGTFVRGDLDVSKIGTQDARRSRADLEGDVQRMASEIAEIRQELREINQRISRNS